jgi:hypothetical protein
LETVDNMKEWVGTHSWCREQDCLDGINMLIIAQQ